MKKRFIVISLSVLLSIITLLFVFLAVSNIAVINVARSSEITNCNDNYSITKKYDCIVVLGAGLKPDGSPSHMLEDRLRAAISLYHSGVSNKVLLSGDNSGDHYDEVTAMENYCIEKGIPTSAIIRDDIGFSTYETMDNTINSMGYKNIIIVTQEYHLYRALYIAKRLGANADGFSSDYRMYSFQIKRDIREIFARAKDFCQTSFVSVS